MGLYKESAIKGFKKGVTTLWNLSKIVVPIYFLVTFLNYTGILELISDICRPVMNIFGLPGEASLPLVLGNCINLYAGLGAMASIVLTTKQVTILAIMLSFSHSLFLESAVVKRVGVNIGLAVVIRLSLALVSGVVFNFIL